jgi:hypothetical protein
LKKGWVKQAELPAPLSSLLETTLRDDNVWWRDERVFGLPPMCRWAFQPVLRGVRQGMTPVTVVRVPRQIGKTTLLNQVDRRATR